MTGKTPRRGQRKNRPRGVPSQRPGVLRRAAKAAGGLMCQECGIIQHAGKWYFGSPPHAKLTTRLCPACQRVRDKYPAGTLRIPVQSPAHQAEVLGLIRNIEAGEKSEHPLERVMDIEYSNGQLVVTTTGVHLAREIAHKLAKQFHRKPRLRYADGEDLVYVDWKSRAGSSGRAAGAD